MGNGRDCGRGDRKMPRGLWLTNKGLCVIISVYLGRVPVRSSGRERPKMEQIERIFVHDPEKISTAGSGDELRVSMSFLAENPEAFGMISDACPLATGSLLIGGRRFCKCRPKGQRAL